MTSFGATAPRPRGFQGPTLNIGAAASLPALPAAPVLDETPTPAGAVPSPTGDDLFAQADAALPGGNNAALGQSPAYLAFLRALGLSDATDTANNQVTIDALNRRAGLSLENLAASGAQQRQGISDSHESRGLYRSGARLRAQAGQQEGEARQGSAIAGGAADDTAALVADLAQRRAERQQKSAEMAYGAATDVYGGV